MKDLLGGKGAGLAEMTNAGLPVPPGFTISTAACNLYMRARRRAARRDRRADRRRPSRSSRSSWARSSATPRDPLLVSVRSGAKFSMPGMMDTILNLGLNDRSVEGLKAKTGNGRFAKDCYRRFIQMFGNVVLGIDKDKFEHELHAVKKKNKAKADVDLDEKRARRGHRALQGRGAEGDAAALPAGPARAARGRARRRVPVVDEPPRHHLPQAERHPARPRHRGQRAEHGLRQHGRQLGHRRRLHPQPLDGREGVLRRVPAERAGRGRGGGHPHAAPDHRPREGDAGGLPAAPRDHDPPGAALQGRPGLRVHDPGQHALHAPDPQRQAHRPGRGAHRGGHGARRASSPRRRRC